MHFQSYLASYLIHATEVDNKNIKLGVILDVDSKILC